jgi:predicted RNA-binding protein with PUA-like domain
MKPGDKIFIYHRGLSAAIGVATIGSEARDDRKNPGSAGVDIEFLSRLAKPVSLADIKSMQFDDWALACERRLSMTACPANSSRGCTPEFLARNFEPIFGA